ncbi:extracellular solute-binding protein [Ponticoccus sp. SC2-23]|uniref:extracellular solute-binding protein n=1 Tax=Alexandriicola marinus TaxID=2081710 RepID=UPI000FD8361A|nr:extracellular solute-binding protein [Alexandriicola marinus]MBM1220868.1 extracellular solute-binding protein [Ponticoccus sp. SC6-9]MBM1225438.1 extracellular solute-binding protein [Ponticoccus sp. SC6-15]MBM1227621.1 extracellular solute-binding protein [Ponticoccus sp. SC6-38]MBM1234741.1 extracellular solute-binding protein [Ponticoccus sp. SC6-45]MBM1238123.1 extracellular solute-binding protein [Ponticoccus sp. SC6-49]MBM1244244.1 extracellular solute-binding protein [Ponticoccus s
MKTELYNMVARSRVNRRRLLQGAASAGALAAMGARPAMAEAHGSVRAEILKIPGVGMGSPTDADWQKVGELCLGPTKERVAEGEFAGVELTFMGLNNQNLHNFLFRGFLKPWEAYTGATINWIDLAQADYNARLQQSIATGTVDFDIIEMGAPFEGDTAGRGLLDEMPEWVKEQIEADDLVGYLQPPVGTWDGKTYRITIDGDCHTFAYRTDYFGEGAIGGPKVPSTWQEVNAASLALKGQTDPLTGLDAHGFLDPLKYQWGGFGFYFLADRASSYVKHPDSPAWLFEPETMKPMVNNPGWVQAIQDVFDLVAADAYPADQVNADPNTTAFSQFLAGTGSMLTWWGDVGSNARTSDSSVVGDVVGFGINPGSERRFNAATASWEDEMNEAPVMSYIGWGIYVTSRVSGDDLKRKAAWSAAAHLGGKDLSLWTSAYPSGFQPYRNSHFQYEEWEEAGYDRAFVEDYLGSNVDSYNHPNAAIEPRIPGIFQYYSIAEDELVKGINGQYGSAQETADAIAAAWEDITDQIGRESQIALYKASLGM